MYEQLRQMDVYDRVETLTRVLVGMNSVNGTTGEAEIADFLKDVLLSFPYFQEHPERIWEQKLSEDHLGRKNIFALLAGPSRNGQTVVWHSHFDTVGIDDFGGMREQALRSDELSKFFAEQDHESEAREDALSGAWMFGRGSADMKSGIAVHMMNLLYFSEHHDELPGNILLMLNADEESENRGIIAAISELRRLQEEDGLHFVTAINNDYISPLYNGDPHHYIYTGVAGKLLPSFYIRGREAHVGETFSGIDPNLISSGITRRVHNNIGLIEEVPDELTLPPTCLYQRDNKEAYNVQTAASSSLYFNYFIYTKKIREVMDTLLDIAAEAAREAERYVAEQYEEFSRRTGLPAKPLSWNIEVTSLADYVNELARRGMEPHEAAREVYEHHKEMEPRALCFKIVEALQNLDPENEARVIVFFAPPYLPHNYLDEEKEEDQELVVAIEEVLEKVEQETGEKFALKKFFPYLADGSFLSLQETDEEMTALTENTPEWDRIYPLPVTEIRELNLSSVNIGVYGRDVHKWTERVYKPYTFGILPGLIRTVTRRLLNNANE